MAKKYLGGSNYKLFSNPTLRAYIKKYFSTEVVAAYDALQPYAYKADLGRLCVLYIRGGWYADIGIRVASNFDPPNNINRVLFRELYQWTNTSWACCHSIIFARPGQKFLQTAVEMIVQNVKSDYYGVNPMCPTGPNLFGRAVASQSTTSSTLYGDSIQLTKGYSKQNRAFVLPDGHIMAFVKDLPGGNLSELGLKGGNNYNEFWHARKIYGQ